MRKRFKPLLNHNSEFALDLAPLLAVMVKLVPVLLVSSAFVQMLIIETELPQVVQQAIEQQNKDPKATQVAVEVSRKFGVKFIITENGKQMVETVALTTEKELDLPRLHAKFQEIKKSHPEIFKIEMSPEEDVPYSDVVRVMDEARKSRSNDIKFPVKDMKTGQDTSTLYMFPEVVFGNTMDG
ncbi:MAG: TolR-like protein [Bdellovibrionales bacterium RIFCSPHIGHO2_01_FULL_40_29]|nr:MAG: TolR-like protein [Bdellovibrionales bacterium RIFCSPHIGHO2_01_FULL_40_29]OFZ32750.1 MAG: TolR-like protein [Bdellovibrionales bacterium RIFCSPHIGHO2_02_FULL_40_15]